MSLKITYLDDEPELCSIFLEIFSEGDIEITTFSDPSKAIEHIRNNPPDLIFLDFRLPLTTGDEIALKLDPAIPKALITGDLNVTPIYQFDRIFSKPFDLMDVRAFIHSFKNERMAG